MDFFTTVAFPWVIGEEGKFQNDPRDKGNWTGGAVGKGVLRGTKYGISAARYPNLDIENLTLANALPLAKADYWDQVSGDLLPPSVGLCVFDFGYNAGPEESIVVLQRALGCAADGKLGPHTLGLLSLQSPPDVVRAFLIQRLLAYKKMVEYPIDGAGWDARAKATAAKALTC